MVPEEVETWLVDNHFGIVSSSIEIPGGCINHGLRIQTKSGLSFFLKVNQSAPPDMFKREFEGLLELDHKDSPKVPKPYLCGREFLLLEDLNPSPGNNEYWTVFGRRLAALHNYTNKEFGYTFDNYIGFTPQSNKFTENGYDFFIESRLLHVSKLVLNQKLISNDTYQKIVKLTRRLEELIPYQPPSLLHGDLWVGNAISDSTGAPALIDPAVHYGWAEADLAMTALFGSFPDKFFASYEEVRTLESGYKSRFPIYNLYHVLNHVLLFGIGYLGLALDMLNQFE